jgi:polyisoprenoid-binding protein YceI
MKLFKLLLILLLFPSIMFATSFKIDKANSYIGIKYQSNTMNDLVIRLSSVKGGATIERGRLTGLNFKASLKKLTTGNKDRDTYLKESVFRTNKYKSIHFETISVERSKGGMIVTGMLTISGKSIRGVELPIRITGPVEEENKKARLGVSSEIEISRKAFNMTILDENEKISDNLLLNIQLQLKEK